MKKHFISITLVLFIIGGCASGKQGIPPDSEYILSAPISSGLDRHPMSLKLLNGESTSS